MRAKATLWFGALANREHKFSKRYLGASQDSKHNSMSASFQHSFLHLTGGGSLKLMVMIKLYSELSPNPPADLDLAAMKEETQELSKQLKQMTASISSKKEETQEFSKQLKQMSAIISSMKVSSGLSLECPVCYEEVKPPMRLKHCAQVTKLSYIARFTYSYSNIL